MQILKFGYEFKQDRLIVVFRQMSNAKYNLEETHNKMVCPFVFFTLVYKSTKNREML
jgi:hypothetical protein